MQDPTIPQSCSRKQEGFAVKTPRIGLLQLVCPNDDLAHIEAIMLDELDHMLCPLAFDAFLMSFHSPQPWPRPLATHAKLDPPRAY